MPGVGFYGFPMCTRRHTVTSQLEVAQATSMTVSYDTARTGVQDAIDGEDLCGAAASRGWPAQEGLSENRLDGSGGDADEG